MSHELPQLASTLHNIEEWYNHIFTHLGWMILASGKGSNKKLQDYKRSLIKFIQTTDHVSDEYENPDRLHDLNVMRMHVEYLIDFLNEHHI